MTIDEAVRVAVREAVEPLVLELAALRATLVTPPPDPNELLTVSAWAAERGVSAAAAYKLIERGRLTVERAGRSIRVRRGTR